MDQGAVEIASVVKTVFSNVLENDMLIYSTDPSYRIQMGVNVNSASSTMQITSTSVTMFNNLGVSNAEIRLYNGLNNGGFARITSSSSNMGVGRSNPAYTLDVGGDVNITGNLYHVGQVSRAWRYNGIGTNTVYWMSNVGIGLVNPAYNLDVNGTFNVAGIMYQSGVRRQAFNTNGTVLSTDTGVNVGIGTASPGYALDVNGSVNFASTMFMANIARRPFYVSPTQSNVFYAGGSVGIGKSNPVYNLDVTGALNVDGQIFANQVLSQPMWVGSNGSLYYNSNIGIFTSNPAYALDVNGSVNMSGAVNMNGSVYQRNILVKCWNLAATGSNIYYTAGSVGVGTSNPQYPLDIGGSMNIGSNLYDHGILSKPLIYQPLTGAVAWSNNIVSTCNVVASNFYLRDGTASVSRLGNALVLVNNDYPALKLNPLNGFVGIGSNVTAQNQLHVIALSNSPSNSNATLLVENSNATVPVIFAMKNNTSNLVSLSYNGTSASVPGSAYLANSAGLLVLQSLTNSGTNSTAAGVCVAGSNVGFNTLTPTSAIEVFNGSVFVHSSNATNGVRIATDSNSVSGTGVGTGSFTIAHASNIANGILANDVIVNAGAGQRLVFTAGSNAPAIVLNNNNCIGINMSNATRPMHMGGEVAIQGVLTLASQGSLTSGGMVRFASNSNSTLYRDTSTQNIALCNDAAIVFSANSNIGFFTVPGPTFAVDIKAAQVRVQGTGNDGYLTLSTQTAASTGVWGAEPFSLGGALNTWGGGTTTATPVAIYTASTERLRITETGIMQFSPAVANRKIVLAPMSTCNNDHQFTGLGISGASGGTMRHQVPTASDDHVFFSAINSSQSLELLRVTGAGKIGITTSVPMGQLHISANNSLSNNIVFEAGQTFDGSNIGLSAINFNGYTMSSNQAIQINPTKTRWRLAADQRTSNDALIIDGFLNGSNLEAIRISASNVVLQNFVKIVAPPSLTSPTLVTTANTGASMNVSSVNALLALSQDSAFQPGSSVWQIFSDVRIKEDIKVADFAECYDKMKALDLKTFKVKKEYGGTATTKYGWIAQEVGPIIAGTVGKADMCGLENFHTLNTDQIYAVMYGTIRRLQEKIEALEGRGYMS